MEGRAKLPQNSEPYADTARGEAGITSGGLVAPEGLEQVRVLRLEPGDVLVYRYPDPLSMERAKHLTDRLQEAFPGRKVIVLDCGASVDVLRAEEIA